ncbi:hypothetical protein ABPG72_010242 [Tetrahymena utriculariae]
MNSPKNKAGNEQDKCSNKKINKLLICLIVLAGLILFSLIYGMYSLLNIFLPGVMSLLVILFLFFYFLKVVIRMMLFPGSVKLMQRQTEYNSMINRAKMMHTKIQHVLSIIECIESQNIFLLMDYSGHNLQSIYDRVTTMIKSYQKLEEKKIISSYQTEFYEALKKLLEQCQKTIITTDITNFTFWDLISDNDHLINIKNKGYVVHFQSKSQVSDLQTIVMETIEKFDSLICSDKLNYKQKLDKWFKNDSFGSLDYNKAELQATYKTKEITIKTKDNSKLDCLLIYGDKQDNNNNEIQQKQPEDFLFLQEGVPTIIFSNPNAGFYEFSKYSNEWVDYYFKKGINTLVWNYRGYGKSEGTPSPEAVFSDAEKIVDYLREHEKVGLIGSHGQSLGGMVACHIAAKKNLDFLCADRTFSCVSDIAYYSMPSFFKQIVRLLTSYDVWSPINYYKANCYKILAYDPKDNIIIYMSSLKNGVSKQIAQSMFLKNFQSQLYHQEYNESFLKNSKGYCMKTWNNDTTVSQVTSIWLNEKDQIDLYGAFLRVTKAIKIILDKKSIQPNQESNRSKQNQKSETQNQNTPQKTRNSNGFMQKQSQSDLNSTLDYSNILNGSLLIDNIKNEENKSSLSNSKQNQSLHISNSEYNCYPSNNIEQRDMCELQDLESQNKGIQPSSPKNNNNDISLSQQPSCMKQIIPDEASNTGYINLFTNEHKQNKEFSKFMRCIFTILDSFDAGGLSLLDVFYLFPQKYSFQIFQLFILNLNIWGSYLPLTQIIRKKMTGILPKKYAIAKIKEMIRKLETLCKNYQEIQDVNEEIQQNIIADINTIVAKLKILKEKLQQNQIAQSNDKLLESINQNKDIQIMNDGDSSKSQERSTSSNPYALSSRQNTPKKLKKDNQGESKIYQNLKEESQPSQLIEHSDINKIVGNLLPLSCGHNGFYSNFEVQLFEFHLKNAGFIKN